MAIKPAIKERYTKVKIHLVENKKAYLIGTGAVVAAVLATVAIMNKQDDESEEQFNSLIDQKWSFLPRSTINEVKVKLPERSTPSRPVMLTDKEGNRSFFASLNETARQTKHNVGDISRAAHGYGPLSDGSTVEFLEPSLN